MIQVVGGEGWLRRYAPTCADRQKRIWLNELAHIHARYVAQAILDNSKWAREGCLVGKTECGGAPLLRANDDALPWDSGYSTATLVLTCDPRARPFDSVNTIHHRKKETSSIVQPACETHNRTQRPSAPLIFGVGVGPGSECGGEGDGAAGEEACGVPAALAARPVVAGHR